MHLAHFTESGALAHTFHADFATLPPPALVETGPHAGMSRTLAIPSQPAFDPTAETVDLTPAGWSVRALTEAELDARAEADSAPYELSKLVVVERVMALGKVVEFMSFLDANGGILRLLWDSTTVLLSDNPLFTTYAPAAKAAMNLTDSEFASVIAR